MLRQMMAGAASLALIFGSVTSASAADEAKPARKPGQGRPAAGKQGEGRQMSPEVLKRFDKNSDGKLDDSERNEMMLAKFDKNKDGKLDDSEKAEIKKASGGRTGAGKPSAGGSTSVDREAILKKFDKNGDGKLDDTEKEAAKKELGGRRGGKPSAK